MCNHPLLTLCAGILIENMRREGFEFEIGPPKVITKEIDGKKCEPFEEAIVEVPDNSIGAIVELFAQRKGEMIDMAPFMEGSTRVKFRIATRGLLGLRNALLTATRGMAIMNTIFLEYAARCACNQLQAAAPTFPPCCHS